MSAREYNLWIAEYGIEPWGQDREDIQYGLIVQSIRAANSKKGVTLNECIVNFEPQKKKMDWRQWQESLKSRTIAMGGKVK